MKYPRIIIAITILTLSSLIGSVSFAFIGPGSLTPGTGNGALQVDSNLNIGFGTNLATPTGDATNALFGRVFTIASTSDPGISLRNLGGGRNYTMYSRANGRFVIWDDFSSRPRFFIDANGFVGISGNSTSTYFFTPASALHVAGSIQSDAAFVGAVAPSSITGGAFQSSNYAFPSAVGVGTSTTSGLPTGGMYVAGNVGIGTVSPGAKLDVMGSDADNAVLARFYANTSSRGSFIIRNGTGSNPTTFIGTAGSNEHLAIGAVNTERIRIAPGGNVGIGSTSPNAPLEIGTQGSIQGANVNLILSGSGGYPGIQFWNASGVSRTIIRQDSTNDRLAIFTNTGTAAVPVLTEKITLLNSGNFGIGVAAPTAKLHIYGEGATDMIKMTANYATPQVWTQYVDSGGWYLKQDATFPFHVHSGGNVGIGTNTPGQKLTVAGVIESTTGGIKFPDGTTQVTAGGGTGTSVGWSRTGTNVYLTTSTDWVGVGTTTPTQALDVRGNIYVSGNIVTGGTMTTNVGASNVSAGSFGTTAGKGNYRFEGAATTNDVLKIDATNERVGVGTASPGYTLDVNGILNVATGLRVGGAAASTNYLRGNGTNFIASTIQASDVPTLNQNTTGSAYYLNSRDTRAVNDLPQDFGPLVKYDFKSNGTNGLSDGGSYNGVMTWRKYGSSSDLSGGPVLQLAYSDNNNLWTRLSTGTSTWGTWEKILNDNTGVMVQATTPGTAQTGHLNISGTGIFGGSVGVGTSTPSQALAVVGNIYATGNVIAGGTMTANVSAPNVSAGTFGTTAGKGNYTFEAAANTNNVLKVDATNERVGIGTASPAEKLSVNGNIEIQGVSTTRYIITNETGTGTGELKIQAGAGSSGFGGALNLFAHSHATKPGWATIGLSSSAGSGATEARFTVNNQGLAGGTDIFTVLRTGNVGIGTTAPGAKLEVAGSIKTTDGATGNYVSGFHGYTGRTQDGVVHFAGSAGFAGETYINYNGGSVFVGKGTATGFQVNNAAFNVLTNGNVGIGTTGPTEKLDVSGAITFNGTTAGYGTATSRGMLDYSSDTVRLLGFGPNTSTYPAFQIYQAGANNTSGRVPLQILSNGNVGIGTTSPTLGKLQVAGGIISGAPANSANSGLGVKQSANAVASGILLESATNQNNGGMYATDTGLVLREGGVDTLTADSGSVGISTTTPVYKLAVVGTGYFANPVVVGSPTDNSHATTKSYVDSLVTGGATSGNLATLVVTGTTTLASTAGKVIIGGAGPALKLDVTGQGQFTDTMSATKYYDYNDPTYYVDPANTGTALKFNGAMQAEGTGVNYLMGQLGVGASNPGTHRFYVGNGTSYFNNSVSINGTLTMVGTNGITLSGGNIGSVGKLTVTTIDPLYEIDGEKYATFASSIAGGVKEEYVGRAKLEPTISNSKFQISNEESIKIQNLKLKNSEPAYSYVIDFSTVPKGSDLWVWYQAVDFDKKNVEALVTAYDSLAKIGYKIDGKKLIFFSDEETEFSFRLVGNRHDWKEWPTYNKDQDERPSFILKSK